MSNYTNKLALMYFFTHLFSYIFVLPLLLPYISYHLPIYFIHTLILFILFLYILIKKLIKENQTRAYILKQSILFIVYSFVAILVLKYGWLAVLKLMTIFG